MSKDNEEVIKGVATLIIGLVVIGCLWWSLPKLWGWVVRVHQNAWSGHDYYCQDLKKIVEADPLYEDDGKYEDESYRVKYEDGSVGLIDNATMKSGSYCVSESWLTPQEADRRGWVLKP